MGARADVTVTIDQSAMTSSYMTVLELDDTYLWGQGGWGIPDLSVYFNETGYEMTMVPNSIGDPDPYWYTPSGGPGSSGNKLMEASLYNEAGAGTLSGQTVTFEGNVTSNTLTSAHTAIAFIRDFEPDYSSSLETTFPITSTGEFSISLATNSDPNRHVQYGIQMKGVNVWVTDLEPYGSIVVEAVFPADAEAPMPDPMTFDTVPYATGDGSISMTATTATDNLFDVEYLFTCTAGGGHDSGWQSSTIYEDTGLTPATPYTYTVTARDTHPDHNTTVASDPASATTLGGDTDAPSPDPMTFDGTEASPVSVKLTATTATDASAVEYYFTNTSGGGNDSGWQNSPIYVDTGLAPGSNYTYTVTARDKSAAQNTTAASGAVLVTTTALPGSSALFNSLQGFTGDNTQGLTIHELALAGLELASDTAEKIVGFDGAGATFGDAATWESRNTLRTLGQDYGDGSFEAAATFITQNTTEQAAFIGVGQGIIGNWGVPDFELVGVNAINAEMQGNFCKIFTHTNGVIAVIDQTDAITTVTNRVRMIHDADAETITVELDTDYAGGAFVADRILGTHSTVGVWADMPQRIYIAAGAGVVLKDFSITSSLLVDVENLSISGPVAGGGMVLSWDGSAGQTYDVQYKTDLVAGTWTVDPSPGCSDIFAAASGTTSATSTVSAAEVFYQVIPK